MEPSRPSATPLKNSTAAAVAGGGEPPYDGGMEHRMTALETRLDTILPTLATKADVEALRGDMEKRFLEVDTKFAEMRAEIQQVELRMNAKFDAGFESLRAEMHKMNADIKTWALATMIAIIGTILAGIIGIGQLTLRSAVPHAAAPTHLKIAAIVTPAPPAGPA